MAYGDTRYRPNILPLPSRCALKYAEFPCLLAIKNVNFAQPGSWALCSALFAQTLSVASTLTVSPRFDRAENAQGLDFAMSYPTVPIYVIRIVIKFFHSFSLVSLFISNLELSLLLVINNPDFTKTKVFRR